MSKANVIGVLTAILILSCTEDSQSQKRSGLITGFGTNLTPLAYTGKSGDGSESFPNQGLKIGLNFGMGYAIDHRRVIMLTADAVFPEDPEGLLYVGPLYFYYYHDKGNSLYFVGGLGLQMAAWGGQWLGEFAVGPGLRGGLGYEITPRVQCDTMISLGRTSRLAAGYYHVQISVNLRFHTY